MPTRAGWCVSLYDKHNCWRAISNFSTAKNTGTETNMHLWSIFVSFVNNSTSRILNPRTLQWFILASRGVIDYKVRIETWCIQYEYGQKLQFPSQIQGRRVLNPCKINLSWMRIHFECSPLLWSDEAAVRTCLVMTLASSSIPSFCCSWNGIPFIIQLLNQTSLGPSFCWLKRICRAGQHWTAGFSKLVKVSAGCDCDRTTCAIIGPFRITVETLLYRNIQVAGTIMNGRTDHNSKFRLEVNLGIKRASWRPLTKIGNWTGRTSLSTWDEGYK